MTPEEIQTVMTIRKNVIRKSTTGLPRSYQDQSSSRSHQETVTSEALEQQRASGATGIDNSVSQEQEGNDTVQVQP